jgi:Tfp pilus assembly protein FimT
MNTYRLSSQSLIAGFSLIELFLVIFLITAVLTFSTPHFLGQYQRNKLDHIEKELSGAIHYARNQAILSGLSQFLRAPYGKTWSEGLILIENNSSNTIKHEWLWNYPDLKINWHGFRSNEFILFSSDLRKSASSGHFNFSFNDLPERTLIINKLGRVKK